MQTWNLEGLLTRMENYKDTYIAMCIYIYVYPRYIPFNHHLHLLPASLRFVDVLLLRFVLQQRISPGRSLRSLRSFVDSSESVEDILIILIIILIVILYYINHYINRYIILYYIVLYHIILYYTRLYYIILYYTIFYYTILYYIVLYYIISYHIILYYIKI
jgi:hypothetical protein